MNDRAIQKLTCTGCGEDLPTTSFYVNPKEKRGYTYRCKKCIKSYNETQKDRMKLYYLENKREKDEYQQQYYEEHKDRVRDYQADYREKNKEKLRERARLARARKKAEAERRSGQY